MEHTHTHQLFYNWEYAKEHNPTLMSVGFTGGFGFVRQKMIAAVKDDDEHMAAANFWTLVRQSQKELLEDMQNDYGPSVTMDDVMDRWYGWLLSGECYDDDMVHFIQEVPKRVPWYRTFHKEILFWGLLYIIIAAILNL